MPPAKKKPAKKAEAPSGSPPPAVVKDKSNAALIARLTAEMAEIDKDNKDVVVVGDSNTIKLVGVIPTGSPTLDAAIGRGGYPLGRITVLTGGEGSGKTTHALHAIANCQKMGGVAMYVDGENKLDIDYAASLGVNLSEVVICRPGWAERAFELMQRFINRIPRGSNIPVLIILDSINACVPKAVFDAEDYETTGGMGAQARIFSSAVSKFVQSLGSRPVSLIAISQARDKLGQAGSWKEKVTGGSTWKYYAALIVDLKKDRDADVKRGGVDSGHGIIAECSKNQVAPPFKKAKYDIVWGEGIDYHSALLDQAAKWGILDIGGGGWGECIDPVQPPHDARCVTLATLDDSVKAPPECDCGWEEAKVKWQGVDGMRGFKAMSKSRPDVLAYIEGKVTSHYK